MKAAWQKTFGNTTYNSAAEYISDRDYPLSRSDCQRAFRDEMGRAPTESEVEIMRPNSKGTVEEHRKEYPLH